MQYLNTAPLVWGFTHGTLRGKYELDFTVPSMCADALRNGAADVAIIPAIEYQRIPDLAVLANLAIAAKREVRSLLLIAKRPATALRSVALDRSSRSTQALVRILCARHWKITPEFCEMPPDAAAMLRQADAALLIGDPALRAYLAVEAGGKRGSAGELRCDGSLLGLNRGQELHIYDVVSEWRALTNLPAVLAVWAAQRTIATSELAAEFQASCREGLRHVPAISEEWARTLALAPQALERYLTENIDYSLDAENRSGLARYYAFAHELGLTPGDRALELAG